MDSTDPKCKTMSTGILGISATSVVRSGNAAEETVRKTTCGDAKTDDMDRRIQAEVGRSLVARTPYLRSVRSGVVAKMAAMIPLAFVLSLRPVSLQEQMCW